MIRSYAFYKENAPGPLSFDAPKVLCRSDTRAPLSVVRKRYQVVQLQTILELYRDVTELSSFEPERQAC
ncbi:phage/plasmid-like protein [Alcanivorax venustensis ISO4]|jgi:hypothetical protein|uniref:Phage/plasmid-like protein n=1 Tax=Alloalcanivorax venustensis ISO4 TaxID=1177184 RepID=A0ABS0AFJ9_9GAMM|nr:phage/plasmid-like protein [Alloalcanivorax venustensis ISO4]